MSRIFVELYLDEDVDVLVGELLRRHGFQAETTRDAGRLQRSDSEQLRHAVDRGRAILTHNRIHFEALARQYFEAKQQHYDIIIAVQRPPHQLFRRLEVILNDITASEMENQLVYI